MTPVTSITVASLGTTADRKVVRRALLAGLWIWPSFTALDAFMCFVAFPGAPFLLFVAYRVVIELAFYGAYRVSLRDDVDLARLFRLQSGMFIATAVTISLMAIPLGGIRSPYMHGVSIVALVWAALVPMSWRRALPTLVGIGLAYPVVIAAGVAVSPAARDAWMSADAFIVFGANYVFVVASCVLAVILSDLVWTAQQQARSLGSYQLEERLGQGGMGEVWRATHRLLARESAIKLVGPETLGGDAVTRRKALARFEREAQATASLRSAHTIELYDFGVSEAGTFYYVMELLAGYDAAVLVERFGPTPAGRAVHFLRQVCDSLGEAHATGLVHRDVKPSNVFICRYGRAVDFVKVLDFGLVKPRAVTGTVLTADNVVSGTPAFMSPEQVVGKREVDARSDLYAVGCVGYWLLTGRYVFEGANAVQIMMGHLKGAPEPPSRRAESPIPAALDEILLACLEKDPANRPQTADELAAALAGVTGGDEWTPECAERWWERHCPDVGGPAGGGHG